MLRKLLEYNFDIAGRIMLNDKGLVDFEIHIPEYKSQKYGQVYAWVIGEEVVYIGMASKGVQKRLTEHRGGWRGNSPTGVLKESQLRGNLREGKHITVYARTCRYFDQEVDILGTRKKIRFSLVEHEEDALLKEFQPLWNTNGK